MWLRRGFEARIGVTFSPTFCTAQTQSIRSPVSAKYPARVSRSAAGTSSGVGSSGQLTPLPPPDEYVPPAAVRPAAEVEPPAEEPV